MDATIPYEWKEKPIPIELDPEMVKKGGSEVVRARILGDEAYLFQTFRTCGPMWRGGPAGSD